jgi:hypothetical protein
MNTLLDLASVPSPLAASRALLTVAVLPAASFVDEQCLPPRAAAPSPVAAGVAPAAPTAASDAARVVRPVRPEPLSGTPEGTPGVPDESMWN